MTTPAAEPTVDGDLDSTLKVERLVRAFYKELSKHARLGPIFNETAAVDWHQHLPRMTAYWSRVLLDQPGYLGGSIINIHRKLHATHPLLQQDFESWLRIWSEAVDQRFAGPIAEQAKSHAVAVGEVLWRHAADGGVSGLPCAGQQQPDNRHALDPSG